MSFDKFGRHSTKTATTKLLRGIPGQGFKLTKTNDFDIENKRLCNVGNPIDDQDASTRKNVNDTIAKKCLIIESEVVNCKGKRLTNAAKPVDDKDVATVDFVLKEITKIVKVLNKKIEKLKSSN